MVINGCHTQTIRECFTNEISRIDALEPTAASTHKKTLYQLYLYSRNNTTCSSSMQSIVYVALIHCYVYKKFVFCLKVSSQHCR